MHETRSFSRAELARAAGCTLKAVRHYEAAGLVGPEQKNGPRRYGEVSFARLKLLVALRQIGFSTARIGSLLGTRGEGALATPDLASRLSDEVGEAVRHVSERVEALQRVRHDLIMARETLLRCASCHDAPAHCGACAAEGLIPPMTRTLFVDR